VCTADVAILQRMAQPPNSDGPYEVVCPHCKKQFEAQLLSGESDRHQGFKCPHCRLFIAYARAEEQDRVEPQQS
jgi:DNA-directed RNA polymerase subunit RPC12/RpoP